MVSLGGVALLRFRPLFLWDYPPINANATNNTGTWVGYLSSFYAYRQDLGGRTPSAQRSQTLWRLILISLAGGIIGSVLLLNTPQSVFAKLVPYLLLLATTLFALNPWLKRLQRRHGALPSKRTLLLLGVLQWMVAIYGGYFGGGVGILLLALFGLMGMEDIHAMNGLKTLLSTCINGIAMVIFIASGTVLWTHAILMSMGTILGGYWGVYYIRKVDPKLVRGFVIAVGLGMTLYFFVKAS
jgi:uncharacterized protein